MTAAAVVCGTGGAKFRGTGRREEGSCRREGADRPVPGGHQVHRQQRLAVPVGLLGDVPAGEGSYRQASTEIGAVSADKSRGERLYRQRPHQSSAEAGGRHLERGAVAKACRNSDAASDLARREAGHDLGAGVLARRPIASKNTAQGRAQNRRVEVTLAEPTSPGSYVYPVWYGTNRTPSRSTRPKKGLSSQLDSINHYGKCFVEIPKSHQFGSVGSPWYSRWLKGDDRLSIKK